MDCQLSAEIFETLSLLEKPCACSGPCLQMQSLLWETALPLWDMPHSCPRAEVVAGQGKGTNYGTGWWEVQSPAMYECCCKALLQG